MALYTWISDNFATILVVLFFVTGIFWLLDTFIFAKARRAHAAAIAPQAGGGHADEVAAALARPWWLEYTAGLFGVVAFVFIMRSFVTEPFRIPSGSMLPNLYIGDWILVNKFAYGLRNPLTNGEWVPIGKPQRGDVMVFRYPVDNKSSFIKRVIGVPGDVVRYENKVLTVNGQTYRQNPIKGAIPREEYPLMDGSEQPNLNVNLSKSSEEGAAKHDILLIEQAPPISAMGVQRFGANPACTYFPNDMGFECAIPAGKYLMMGDNRDNSSDGRYWGFVPEQNIIGKAYFVWMNWSQLSRIGTSIR